VALAVTGRLAAIRGHQIGRQHINARRTPHQETVAMVALVQEAIYRQTGLKK
jgi:hypothetical protein